jgi:HK97 family phage major capsid protein
MPDPRHRLTELREHRASLVEQQRSIIDAADTESRSLTSEENENLGRLETEFREVTDDVERRERLAGYETNLSGSEVHEHNRGAGPGADDEERDQGPGSEEYRAAFDTYARRGISGLSDEERSVLNVTSDPEGGFTVPERWTTLQDSLREAAVMRDLATVYPVQGGGVLHVPRVATEADAPAVVPENTLIPDDADEFDEVKIGEKKIARITKASIEMVQDALFPVESFVGQRLGFQLGIAADAAYMGGTGNGETGTQGLFPGASVGVPGASAIGYDQLIDLIYSIKAPYRPNARFLMNDLTVAAVRKLKDNDNRPLWEPSLQLGEPDRLLGYGLRTSQFAPTMGATKRSIAFGDFKRGYWIKDVLGVQIKYLDQRYAELGQVAWRGLLRTGGAIVDQNAIRVLVQAA